MKKKSIKSVLTLYQGASLLAIAISVLACGRANNQAGAGQGIKEYAVIQLNPQTSELSNSYPANINGIQDVEIRSKVNGFITKLCVDEGAVVRKGQALFLIDRVQYEAAVKSAEATVKVAEANVATSKLTVTTKTELAAQDIISQYDLQTAQNELLTREASLAQAKAQLENAKNDLSYTTITSPSDGIVGTIPYRVGSLVGTSTTTPLTTVSDISRVHVYFSMNEKQLLRLTQQGGSMQEILARMPLVKLRLADGSIYPEMGKIETISGIISTATGSAALRATFPNSKNILRSGGTGNIIIPSDMDSVILIPQKATSDIQNKIFACVVTDSSTIVKTEIEILSINDGQNYVVTKGLKAGDRIAVEGVGTMRDGMKIKAITPEESAAKTKGAAQQGSAQK